MRANEFITEAKLTIKDQIINDVKKNGGDPNEYFVRFTGVDKLGYSKKQFFGRSPDADDPKFDINYIGTGKGRPALWFYPLKFYLANEHMYGTENPYIWLVRIKPNAWLQPVKSGDKGIKPAPENKERVGLLRLSATPAAIFFKPMFTIVGKYYDYASRHKRHGQIKGPPKPSFFDKIRGYN